MEIIFIPKLVDVCWSVVVGGSILGETEAAVGGGCHCGDGCIDNLHPYRSLIKLYKYTPLANYYHSSQLSLNTVVVELKFSKMLLVLLFFCLLTPVSLMDSDEENTPPPEQPVSNIKVSSLLSLVV